MAVKFICVYMIKLKLMTPVNIAPVLLRRLFDVGVNGRLWRLLRNWYSGCKCRVKCNGRLSDSFCISPTLFLIGGERERAPP